jgi:hypothetical protein
MQAGVSEPAAEGAELQQEDPTALPGSQQLPAPPAEQAPASQPPPAAEAVQEAVQEGAPEQQQQPQQSQPEALQQAQQAAGYDQEAGGGEGQGAVAEEGGGGTQAGEEGDAEMEEGEGERRGAKRPADLMMPGGLFDMGMGPLSGGKRKRSMGELTMPVPPSPQALAAACMSPLYMAMLSGFASSVQVGGGGLMRGGTRLDPGAGG